MEQERDLIGPPILHGEILSHRSLVRLGPFRFGKYARNEPHYKPKHNTGVKMTMQPNQARTCAPVSLGVTSSAPQMPSRRFDVLQLLNKEDKSIHLKSVGGSHDLPQFRTSPAGHFSRLRQF